jgi:hypothetical protein
VGEYAKPSMVTVAAAASAATTVHEPPAAADAGGAEAPAEAAEDGPGVEPELHAATTRPTVAMRPGILDMRTVSLLGSRRADDAGRCGLAPRYDAGPPDGFAAMVPT